MLSSIILTEHTSLARVMAFSLPRVLCQCSLFCISALPIDLKNSLALELFHALYIKHFEPRSPNGQAWKELRDLSLLKSRLLKTCGYGQRQGHWSRGVFGGMRHPPDILHAIRLWYVVGVLWALPDFQVWRCFASRVCSDSAIFMCVISEISGCKFLHW